MSTRAMASQYQAGGGGGVSATPEGIDLFGIKHRRNLETMNVQAQLQQQIAAHQAQMQKDIISATEAAQEKFRNNESVKKAAEDAKLPLDDYIKLISPGNVPIAKAAQINDLRRTLNAGTGLDPDQNPDIIKANRIRANIEAVGQDPNKLNTVVPLGSIGQSLNIPGVPMNTLQGGTTSETTRTVGGFPMKMPDGSIQMVNGRPIEEKRMNAGKVLPPTVSANELPPNPAGNDGQQPPQLDGNGLFPMRTMPGTPDINSAGLSTMPPALSPPLGGTGSFFNDSEDRKDVAPVPANQQPANGVGSVLSPQWPPRSGLIPGGYDVIGTGIKQNWDQYRNMISDPLIRMLMGGGFTPQSNTNQLSTTPQY